MTMKRREFLQGAVVASFAASAALSVKSAAAAEDKTLIVDTHEHLWDLTKLHLGWHKDAPPVLKQNYGPQEYREATKGLNVKSVYMEVDVDPAQHDAEAEYVVDLCKGKQESLVAAVIGGRPDSPLFAAYAAKHAKSGYVKGVRQVLHGAKTPAGHCMKDDFVRGIRELGKQNLSFDLCLRPAELRDGVKLTELCPDTRFVVDHCGNANVNVFFPKLDPERKPDHTVDEWKAGIDALAKRPNTICKISGIVFQLPKAGDASHLAPIVNYCLDAFGPKRVVFGGDWPVCLLGRPLLTWVEYLRQIVATRPAADQEALWSQNALAFYKLS